MPQDKADNVLATLMDHVVQPSNVYEHDWAPGDLMMWDNAVSWMRVTASRTNNIAL